VFYLISPYQIVFQIQPRAFSIGPDSLHQTTHWRYLQRESSQSGTKFFYVPLIAARGLTSLYLALEAGLMYSHISLDHRLEICGFQLMMLFSTLKSILLALSTVLSKDLGGRKFFISKVVVKAPRAWTKLKCPKKITPNIIISPAS